MPDWSLELTTSGGFAGRGIGRVALDSATAPASVTRAVRLTQPGRWKADYSVRPAAGDRVRYRLALVVLGVRTSTSWTEGDEAAMPADLLDLFEAVSLE